MEYQKQNDSWKDSTPLNPPLVTVFASGDRPGGVWPANWSIPRPRRVLLPKIRKGLVMTWSCSAVGSQSVRDFVVADDIVMYPWSCFEDAGRLCSEYHIVAAQGKSFRQERREAARLVKATAPVKEEKEEEKKAEKLRVLKHEERPRRERSALKDHIASYRKKEALRLNPRLASVQHGKMRYITDSPMPGVVLECGREWEHGMMCRCSWCGHSVSPQMLQAFTYDAPLVCRECWTRDLCADGDVEANPGPPLSLERVDWLDSEEIVHDEVWLAGPDNPDIWFEGTLNMLGDDEETSSWSDDWSDVTGHTWPIIQEPASPTEYECGLCHEEILDFGFYCDDCKPIVYAMRAAHYCESDDMEHAPATEWTSCLPGCIYWHEEHGGKLVPDWVYSELYDTFFDDLNEWNAAQGEWEVDDVYGWESQVDHSNILLSGDIEENPGPETLEGSELVSGTANIQMVDERPVEAESVLPSVAPQKDTSMHEPQWALASICGREMRVAQLTWNTESPMSAHIYIAGLPQILTSVNNNIVSQLKVFSFAKFGVKIRVQLNGTKFHVGRLVVWFRPLQSVHDVHVVDVNNIVTLPHFVLDASVSNSGTLTIPYIHFLNYWPIVPGSSEPSYNTLGQLYITVFNSLKVAEGTSDAISLQVFASLVDIDLAQPTVPYSELNFGMGLVQGIVEGLVKTGVNAIPGVGTLNSMTGGLVDNLASTLTSSLGLNCDKPTVPLQAPQIINKSVGSVASGVGREYVERLALVPGADSTPTMQQLGTTSLDMKFSKLAQIYARVKLLEWSTDQPEGTMLFRMPVSPLISQVEVDGWGQATFCGPPVSYVARMFCFWRGALRQKIQMIASQFHTGRLALVYVPRKPVVERALTLDEAMNYNVAYIDLQEKHEVETECAFVSPTQWLVARKYRDVDSRDDAELLGAWYMGEFYMFVANRLSAPGNVSNSIDINVLVAGGPDFEVTVPISLRDFVTSGGTWTNPPYELVCDDTPTYRDACLTDFWGTTTKSLCCAVFPLQGIATKGSEVHVIYFLVWCFYDTRFGDRQDLFREFIPTWTVSLNGYSVTFNRDIDQKAYINEWGIRYPDGPTPNVDWFNWKEPVRFPGGKTFDGRFRRRFTWNGVDDTNIREFLQHHGVYPGAAVLQLTPEVCVSPAMTNYSACQFYGMRKGTSSESDSPYYSTKEEIKAFLDLFEYPIEKLSQLEHDCEFDKHFINNGVTPRYIMQDIRVRETIGVKNFTMWGVDPCQLDVVPCGETQGEQFATTRMEDAPISLTSVSLSLPSVDQTMSESGMQMETVLKRSYPIMQVDATEAEDRLLIMIPVCPQYQGPMDEDKRTVLSPISWIARIFTFWRGGLRYRIVIGSSDANSDDCFVWHNPNVVQEGVTTIRSVDARAEMAYGASIQVMRLAGAVEVEVPSYTKYNQLVLTHDFDTIRNSVNKLIYVQGTLFVALPRGLKVGTEVAVYMSFAEDTVMNVFRGIPNTYQNIIRAYTDGKNPTRPTDVLMRVNDEFFNVPGYPEYGALPVVQGIQEQLDSFNSELYKAQVALKKMQKRLDALGQTKKDFRRVIGSTQGIILNDGTSDKIDATLESVKRAADGISGFVGDASPELQMTSQNFSQLMREAIPLVEKFKNMMPKVEGMVNSTASLSKCMFSMMQFLHAMVAGSEGMALIKNPTVFGAIRFIVALCLLFEVDFAHIYEWILNTSLVKLMKGTQNEAQGWGPVGSGTVILIILLGLAAIVWYVMYGEVPTISDIKDLFTTLKQEEVQTDTIAPYDGKDMKISYDGVRLQQEADAEFHDCPEVNDTQGMVDDWHKFATELRNVTWVAGGLASIEKLFDTLSRWGTCLYEWIVRKVGMTCAWAAPVDLGKIRKEIDFFKDDMNLALAMKSPTVYKRVYAVCAQIESLRDWAIKCKAPSYVYTLITLLEKEMSELRQRVSAAKMSCRAKIDPFHVQLTGKPGVGKSTAVDELVSWIGEVRNWPKYNRTYSKNFQDKFWPRYLWQMCVLIEDLGQDKKDELVAELMCIKSNVAYNLNMAGVEEKGRVFTSEALVTTTNVPVLVSSTAIRCPEAYNRRRNFLLEMRRLGPMMINNENLEGRRLDPLTGRPMSGPAGEWKPWAQWKEIIQTQAREYLATQDILVARSLELNPDISTDDPEEFLEALETPAAKFSWWRNPIDGHVVFADKQPHGYEPYEKKEVLDSERTKSVWSSLYDKFVGWYHTLAQKMKAFFSQNANLAKVAGLLGLLATGGLMYKMFGKTEEPAVQVYVSEGHAYNAAAPKQAKINHCHGTLDAQASEMLALRCHGYLARFRGTLSVLGFWIGKRDLLIPHHAVATLEPGDECQVWTDGRWHSYEFSPKRYCQYSDRDWGVFRVDNRIASKRVWKNLFASQADYGKIVSNPDCCLLTANFDEGAERLNYVEKHFKAKRDAMYLYRDSSHPNLPVIQSRGFIYKANTRMGQCGSPLIMYNPQIEGKICGIHVAGDEKSGEGFSVAICSEQVAECVATLDAQMEEVNCGVVNGTPVPPCVEPECGKIIPAGYFSIAGRVPARLAPAQPRKHDLRKSVLFGTFPNDKAPSALFSFEKDGEFVSPLWKGVSKYGVPTGAISDSVYNFLLEEATDDILAIKPAVVGARVLDQRTAVLGVPFSTMHLVNMASSAGWPWQCENSKGKEWLFDRETGAIIHEEFAQRMVLEEKFIVRGERTPSLWRDCLKTELRSIAKVQNGDTRVFTICPAEKLVLFREYFGAFSDAFVAGWADSFHAVGINPWGYDWTRLWQSLTQKGPHGFAGDFKKFDAMMLPQMIEIACILINRWYRCYDKQWKREDDVARITLIDEVVHTPQLVMDSVYVSHQGNPSGNPITTVLNSIVHYLYLIFAILDALQDKPALLLVWRRHISGRVYGDDGIYNVSDTMLEHFNMKTMSASLAKIGLTYIDASKTGYFREHELMENLSFLKCKFRRLQESPSNYVAQMEVATVYQCVNWVRNDGEDQLFQNLDVAVEFAWRHGEQFYKKFRRVLGEALEKADIRFILPRYETLVRAYLDPRQEFAEWQVTYEWQDR